jgi:hypothetical protein
MPPRARYGLILSLGAALVLLAAGGCGGKGGLAPQQYPGAAEQLVTKADIAKFRPGSPANVLFTWWRSSQYLDRASFLESFDAAIRKRLAREPDLVTKLEFFAGALRIAKPEVVGVEVEADAATVYTRIHFRQPVGSSRYISSYRPQAFSMVREAGGWHIADDVFFELTVQPAK